MMFALSWARTGFYSQPKTLSNKKLNRSKRYFGMTSIISMWMVTGPSGSGLKQYNNWKIRLKRLAYGICFCRMRDWVLVYRFREMRILPNWLDVAYLHPPYLTVMHLIAAIWKCYGAMVARRKNSNGQPSCRGNRFSVLYDLNRRGFQWCH